MSAFALSMLAKVNAVQKPDVEMLVDCAIETLDADDPLLSAINEFSARYQLSRFDADTLHQAGVALGEAVRLHCLPTPIDAARADIYG